MCKAIRYAPGIQTEIRKYIPTPMELSGERPVRWTSKFNFNYSPTDYKTVWYIQNQKLIQRREKEKRMREYFTEEFSSDEYFREISICETLMTNRSTQNMGCRKDLIYRVFSMLPLKLGFSWVQPTSMSVSILSNGPT